MPRSLPGGSVPGEPRPAKPREALDALFAAGHADPLRRALWLDALEQRLRPHLPPALAAHARFANVDGGRLVFLVDSPVWKARLRLASAELLDAARSVGLQCGEVVVKVATTPIDPAPPATRRPVPLSAATREALEAALASLKDGS
ncbi:MAG: DciA family protein [Luteimonas sp.]